MIMRNYKKIVNDILENIKSLQLSPSVLEELVQKHYIENKKIISEIGISLGGIRFHGKLNLTIL